MPQRLFEILLGELGPSCPLRASVQHSVWPARLSKEKNTGLSEPSEPNLQHQRTSSDPEVSRGEPGSPGTEPAHLKSLCGLRDLAVDPSGFAWFASPPGKK